MDPFDLDDPRLEQQLGAFGAMLREGAQLVTTLSDLESFKDAAEALVGLDDRGIRSAALVLLVGFQREHLTDREFRDWVYGDAADE